jgi:hypothetical protein
MRAALRLVATVLLILVVAVSWFRHSIHSIVDPLTYHMFCDEGGRILSPKHTVSLRIVFFDAGATHSGNFRTLVLANDAWRGLRIIANGLSTGDVRYGKIPFPIQWNGERTCSIGFASDHRLDNMVRSIVSIP